MGPGSSHQFDYRFLGLKDPVTVNLTRFHLREDGTYVAPIARLGCGRPKAAVELSKDLDPVDDEEISKLLRIYCDPEKYNPEEKVVFIFDIDGTLRKQEGPFAYFVNEDALDNDTHEKLKTLNSGNSQVIFLTGRPSSSMVYANIDPSFDIYCSSGYARMPPVCDTNERRVEITADAIDLFAKLDHIKHMLMQNPKIYSVAESDKHFERFAMAGPWDMLMILKEDAYQDIEFRTQLITEIRQELVKEGQQGWDVSWSDSRHAILVHNLADKKDKTYAAPRIIDDLVRKDFIPDKIFYFGDAMADYEAMKLFVKEAESLSPLLALSRPNKAKIEVVNVAVGNRIPLDSPDISARLTDYNAVNDFIRLVAALKQRVLGKTT